MLPDEAVVVLTNTEQGSSRLGQNLTMVPPRALMTSSRPSYPRLFQIRIMVEPLTLRIAVAAPRCTLVVALGS